MKQRKRKNINLILFQFFYNNRSHRSCGVSILIFNRIIIDNLFCLRKKGLQKRKQCSILDNNCKKIYQKFCSIRQLMTLKNI
ncbi:hypothetical protein BpHYR1_019118 [Brachionus plicatilis]|uniref:Uncharacterized protein n=1 Tax=Brachionus plicatilis TaxID=10195 RepID=A0A3M7SDD1_BRAPC|nr:hypothetical protein BpHYR1_019118 [Brachionus plicatilis]